MGWFGYSIAVEIVGLCGFFWFMYCNQKSYRQRIQIIDAIPYGDACRSFSREYDAVSYRRHLWYLFTFRNPKRLYGPLTQGVWR